MTNDGMVTLWVGRAASEDAFFDALEVEFSKDGDFLGSAFSRAFGLGYYEDATREAEFWEDPPHTLDEMLTGASYDEVVCPRFAELGLTLPANANCMVLLYDRRVVGPPEWRGGSVELQLMGSVSYRSHGSRR